jgi:sec-independent protein translocase protein TatB
MFDIGFSELMVIGVVALVVIGPERLPKVARTAGHLLGRLQRYVNDVKADINREMELDELRKVQSAFQDAKQSIETSVRDVQSSVQQVEAEVRSTADSLGASGSAGTPGASGTTGSGQAAPAVAAPSQPPASPASQA